MADPTIPTDILDGVVEALEEFGKTMTLRKQAKGALDPADATAGRPRTPSDSTGKVFLYDYSDNSIDGTTVLKGDRQALFDLKGFDPAQPEKDDILLEGTTQWKIVDMNYTEVQAQRVVAIAQVRK